MHCQKTTGIKSIFLGALRIKQFNDDVRVIRRHGGAQQLVVGLPDAVGGHHAGHVLQLLPPPVEVVLARVFLVILRLEGRGKLNNSMPIFFLKLTLTECPRAMNEPDGASLNTGPRYF